MFAFPNIIVAFNYIFYYISCMFYVLLTMLTAIIAWAFYYIVRTKNGWIFAVGAALMVLFDCNQKEPSIVDRFTPERFTEEKVKKNQPDEGVNKIRDNRTYKFSL